MPSILIVTPVHTKINEHTLRCIYELDIPDGYTVDYFQPWQGYTTKDDKGNYDPRGRNNLTDKQNKARDIAVLMGYDYMLFVEEDMIIPPNTIQLLLDCNSGVAYGMYVFRYHPYITSCWLGIDEANIAGISISNFPDVYKANFDSIIDCDGVGFGCTLIHKDVFSWLPFRVGWQDHTSTGEIPHSDMFFSVDCIKHGVQQRCNLSCKCGHITQVNADGKPVASIMYPDKDNVVRFVEYDVFTEALE
jgi:hypothetical protein